MSAARAPVGEWRTRKRSHWGAFAGAPSYESKLGELAQRVDREVVLGFLAEARGRFLDLPCGAGRMSRALAARSPELLVSADYSTGMLAVARRRLANPLLRCDAFALPFRDACFDRVLTLRLIFHYDDPEPILAEAARVLRPGGELVFDTLNAGSSRHLAERILVLLGRRRGRAGLRFLDPAAVAAMLARRGFRVAAAESRFLLPTRAYRALPRALHGLVLRCERAVPSRRRVLTYWRAVRES